MTRRWRRRCRRGPPGWSATHRAILPALDLDVPAVIIGGVRDNRVGRCPAPYHTLAGSVSIERSLYRRSGTRGGTPEGQVVDAVSLRAGVVGDGWLPRTARAMAHDVQLGTSREAEASALEHGRLPCSRASFERVAHIVGALAVADRADIEDVLLDRDEIPAGARQGPPRRLGGRAPDDSACPGSRTWRR